MELNEKYKAYQSKVKGLESLDLKNSSLREFHLGIENLFDGIKSHKSARDFKWLFILLCSLVLIVSVIHISTYGVGFNLLPPVLLLAFWVYYRYSLKKSIEEQNKNNQEIKDVKPGADSEKQQLTNRIQYILNGIEVLYIRVILIRNQYVIFFPIFTLMVIDIIRGPLSIVAFITTTVLAIMLGGFFWIFYFKNELVDLDNAIDELESLKDKLNQG